MFVVVKLGRGNARVILYIGIYIRELDASGRISKLETGWFGCDGNLCCAAYIYICDEKKGHESSSSVAMLFAPRVEKRRAPAAAGLAKKKSRMSRSEERVTSEYKRELERERESEKNRTESRSVSRPYYIAAEMLHQKGEREREYI